MFLAHTQQSVTITAYAIKNIPVLATLLVSKRRFGNRCAAVSDRKNSYLKVLTSVTTFINTETNIGQEMVPLILSA